MSDRIKVYVVDYGRKFLQLQWTDRDGTRRTKSSKVTTRREAERVAAKIEEELQAAEIPEDGSIAWDAFRDLFADQHLSGLAKLQTAPTVSVD